MLRHGNTHDEQSGPDKPDVLSGAISVAILHIDDTARADNADNLHRVGTDYRRPDLQSVFFGGASAQDASARAVSPAAASLSRKFASLAEARGRDKKVTDKGGKGLKSLKS